MHTPLTKTNLIVILPQHIDLCNMTTIAVSMFKNKTVYGYHGL